MLSPKQGGKVPFLSSLLWPVQGLNLQPPSLSLSLGRWAGKSPYVCVISVSLSSVIRSDSRAPSSSLFVPDAHTGLCLSAALSAVEGLAWGGGGHFQIQPFYFDQLSLADCPDWGHTVFGTLHRPCGCDLKVQGVKLLRKPAWQCFIFIFLCKCVIFGDF